MTIFRGIHALDGDKPNTPNSDVYYAIVKGNEQGKFSLESGHRTALILRKPVDYDSGDREFNLIITATVSIRKRDSFPFSAVFYFLCWRKLTNNYIIVYYIF